MEAVVNSRLISLRAPIDGRIEDFTPTIGTAVPSGRFMLHISNSRADRGRLDDLQRLLEQTEGERPGIAKRLLRLKEIHEQITQQARAFQTGRIRELEERALDLRAQISATEASVNEVDIDARAYAGRWRRPEIKRWWPLNGRSGTRRSRPKRRSLSITGCPPPRSSSRPRAAGNMSATPTMIAQARCSMQMNYPFAWPRPRPNLISVTSGLPGYVPR